MRAGRLPPEAPLPTVRACAASLGVSPATVASAYRLLRERGLVVTRGRRGTRVSPQPPLPTLPSASPPPGVLDLATGNPDLELLPPLGPALARLDPPRRAYGEALKDPALEELARRQLRADGIAADYITVVSGALDGLERVMAARLRPGDGVALEDPAFSGTLALLHTLGLTPVPVAMDERGLLPEALERALRTGARAVVVTPRAQNPTGAAFDAARARALGRVLRAWPDVLVMEDDHAGPVSGATSQSICKGRRHWAVARSYSKSLGPDLRVAVLVGDAETIARVEGRQLIGMRWVSHVLQQLVVALHRSKQLDRQLARAAHTYNERRLALIRALADHGIAASGRSGLNVWIPVPEEAACVSGLLEAGYAVSAGERFRLASPAAIRVTTACLAPAKARRFADALAQLLAPSSRTHAS